MDRKEAFSQLVQKHGYRSINHFCIENKMPQTNMSKRLNGNQNVELPLLFDWADILQEPIDTLIEIFYPDRMEQNRKYTEQ